MTMILVHPHAPKQGPQRPQEAPSALTQEDWNALGEDAPESTPQPLPQLDWDSLGEDEPEVTPPESVSPVPLEKRPFFDALDSEFGLSAGDWQTIVSAVRTAKACEDEGPTDEGLTEISPFLFVGSLFRATDSHQQPGTPLANRDRFFEVLGLALDMGELTVDELPQVVLLDDADSRIVIRGIAVPVSSRDDGRTVWDTSRLTVNITSKTDPGSQPVPCGVRKTSSGEYLLVDFTPIRRSLPRLYAKLKAHGLFLRQDLRPYSKDTRTVLLHRLTLAAGGVNVAGMEGDHLDASTGAWFGGPSTFDAHFGALKARTHDEHTAITIKRGQRHYYTEGARTGGGVSASRLAQGAAEGIALLREVEEMGRQIRAGG